jgi:pectinesterase
MKEIKIPAGIYYKKTAIDQEYYRQNNIMDESVHLCGQGRDITTLSWNDGGFDRAFDDAEKLGTFRSYTLYVSGKEAVIENMTIENTAGDGRLHGQGIALYADAEKVTCRNVRLRGHQDTLFMSPLPQQEREKDGFRGPGQNRPRIMTKQLYENCIIEGDVDFIFGGADAVFRNCTIVSLYRAPLALDSNKTDHKLLTSKGVRVQGYICAPNTPADQPGIRFENCSFITDRCPDGSVYLARPWRLDGACTFISCTFGSHIAPEKFAGWKDIHKLEETARFNIK